MHPKLNTLLHFILLVTTTLGKTVEIQCPSHCKCDIFEKLKRANCTNRNLVVIQSNLPQQTQVLDLSYNQISHLDDQVFTEQNLLLLKLLNISHNKVSQIHINAFEGLDNLKTLDLSYNALQYILQNWFWSLHSLEELYLRGNSFGRLNDESLFASNTLKRLDLSSCHISYLAKEALKNLPNLEVLDVSENYLIHLEEDAVKPLENLKILDVKNNTLSCDGVSQNLTNYCVRKGIRFQDPCQIRDSDSEKFQRIVNMAEPEDEKNSWIYDDQENIKNITTIIDKCNDTRADKSLLQEIVDLSPTLSILIPFIYGIAVGLLIGCTVQISSKSKSDLNENTYISFDEGDTHLRRRRRFTRTSSSEERQSLPLKEWKLSESTPVLYRKNQVNLL